MSYAASLRNQDCTRRPCSCYFANLPQQPGGTVSQSSRSIPRYEEVCGAKPDHADGRAVGWYGIHVQAVQAMHTDELQLGSSLRECMSFGRNIFSCSP